MAIGLPTRRRSALDARGRCDSPQIRPCREGHTPHSREDPARPQAAVSTAPRKSRGTGHLQWMSKTRTGSNRPGLAFFCFSVSDGGSLMFGGIGPGPWSPASGVGRRRRGTAAGGAGKARSAAETCSALSVTAGGRASWLSPARGREYGWPGSARIVGCADECSTGEIVLVSAPSARGRGPHAGRSAGTEPPSAGLGWVVSLRELR